MLNRSLWQILAGIWFLLTGIFALTNITFQFAAPLMAILALVIGVLLLWGK